jgi:hypothetical protein
MESSFLGTSLKIGERREGKGVCDINGMDDGRMDAHFPIY